jgi:recombination protein RecR
MAQYPEPLERLVREFKKLPGIGRRTAERLAFYLLNQPDEEIQQLGQALTDLKAKIRLCRECFNFTEEEVCKICQDPGRDRSLICVVSNPQELWKIERSGGYHGLYHVLGGLISPVNDVHPEDLRIEELMRRLQGDEVKEVILALDPTVEGEHTSMYLARQVKPLGIATTRIAQGVPIGRDLEFTDEVTLSRALQGRVAI